MAGLKFTRLDLGMLNDHQQKVKTKRPCSIYKKEKQKSQQKAV